MSNLLVVLKRLESKMDQVEKKVCALLDSKKSADTIAAQSERPLAYGPKIIAGEVDAKPIRKKRNSDSGN